MAGRRQWIQREEVEECKRKISDLERTTKICFQITNFIVALSLFSDCFL